MKPRVPLSQMGRKQEPMAIAGKPADVCPYCGCAMFANGTRDGDKETFRYVVCKKPRGCGRSFFSRQPPAVLVREIGADDEPSRTGKPALTLVRESA
jgi:hypothetical protein